MILDLITLGLAGKYRRRKLAREIHAGLILIETLRGLGVSRESCSGICGELRDNTPGARLLDTKQWLRDAFSDWPGFSGNLAYPVPGLPDPEASMEQFVRRWIEKLKEA